MTNEEVRKGLREAMDLLKEIRIVNLALNHADGQLDKAEKEGYDRGLNDCWEMVKRIALSISNGGFSTCELFDIFGDSSLDVLIDNTPQEALAKIRAWEEKKTEEERKKQEEAEKIQIGDVVEVYKISDTSVGYNSKGILISDRSTAWIIMKKSPSTVHDFIITIYPKDEFTIIKSDKHVDILGVFE